MADARAELGEQGWRFFSGMHELLLRVAGRVPDEWLTLMRGKLAGGDLAELPDHVSGAAVELGLPLTVGEVALLREIARTVFAQDLVGIEQMVISARRRERSTGSSRCRRESWRRTPDGSRRGWISPMLRVATCGSCRPPWLISTISPCGSPISRINGR